MLRLWWRLATFSSTTPISRSAWLISGTVVILITLVVSILFAGLSLTSVELTATIGFLTLLIATRVAG